mmetsp:Transcript_22419/g.33186  ORF Transcript_22419/g.33186 Transcript_22419/m.33186 type:complete len:552 (-) Transcript_22419:235-1890(-)
MYCGDETGSFIGELTSSSCRFGYGGEDCPKSVLSSYMYRDGTIPTSTNHCAFLNNVNNENGDEDDQDIVPIFQPYPQSQSNDKCKSSTDPNDFLNNGLIENYDAWENTWHKAFHQLNVGTRNKHTKGGIKINTKRVYSSGVSSSHIKNDENDSSVEIGELMHPILAIDHGYTHLSEAGTGQKYANATIQKQKSTMLEILYESLSAPATFIAPAPMLASFGNGRQTSLVVDVGAGGTRVTPIVDGMLLQQAQRRNGRGGDWLAAVQEQVAGEMSKGKEVLPRYAIGLDGKSLEKARKSVFHQVGVRDCMYEMKTAPHMTGVALYRNDEWTIPFFKEDGEGEMTDESNVGDAKEIKNPAEKMEVDEEEPGSGEENDDSDEEESYDVKCKRYYELPDGTRVNFQKSKNGKDMCRLNELLFASELPFSSSKGTAETLRSSSQSTLSDLPIHELIKDSLSAVPDADIRKELCGNIILTGAASLVPNIEQRLSLEAQYLVPGMYKCRLIATRNTIERRYASWIGGSVLSSLGSFQQLWLSKKEYEEYGMTLASQRFP